jgi:hypothetical protein
MLVFVTLLAVKVPGTRVVAAGMRSMLLTGAATAVYATAWRLPHWIHGASAWRYF